ncbi:cactus-binding C-terminus of cactin protein-domain-containing protein [Chytriomyces sp. MP71]|nr:cactus-binding C-terminus of cactin protein-domain-containing protein [Chytriomyces sp. MP71]
MGSDGRKSKKDRKGRKSGREKREKGKRRHGDDSASDSDQSSASISSEDRARKRQKRREEKELLKQELLVQKEAHLAEQMAAQLGYSNKDNPFGDEKLNQKFVWVKKRERELKQGVSREDRAQRDFQKKHEVEAELERLKESRNQRDLDLQLREQEAARLKREQDRAALGDWEKREDVFHWQQAKTRAKIRISEGRAKPIDIIAVNVSLASDASLAQDFNALGFDIDTEEPYLIFANLNLAETRELHADIRLYMELETVEENKAFWEAMLVVCDDEVGRLERARDVARGGGAGGKGAARGMSRHELDVQEDIKAMLEGKSYAQLQTIQGQVERRLSGESGPVDVEFWEAVMKALIVWKAKAKLRDMHKRMLEVRLQQLRDAKDAPRLVPGLITGSTIAIKPSQSHLAGVLPPSGASSSSSAAATPPGEVKQLGRGLLVGSNALAAKEAAEKAAKALKEMENVNAARGGWDEDLNEIHRGEEGFVEKYNPSMSPLLTEDLLREDRYFDVLEEEADHEELMNKRRQLLKELAEAAEASNQNQAALEMEASFIKNAAVEMEEDEEAFMEEARAAVDKTTYLWQDKYRPRKPRYFNRVHTGYEWNKYNQTHYDSDNPPPKVVQGYKFNIFYPDLIDKTKTPTYKIEKDEGYPDTVILRFIASAPYEDIAFRIVRKEWEYSHKTGFRSSFDRGVLQLHFHFKRQFYRR